jgi:hypothetical protein
LSRQGCPSSQPCCIVDNMSSVLGNKFLAQRANEEGIGCAAMVDEGELGVKARATVSRVVLKRGEKCSVLEA